MAHSGTRGLKSQGVRNWESLSREARDRKVQGWARNWLGGPSWLKRWLRGLRWMAGLLRLLAEAGLRAAGWLAEAALWVAAVSLAALQGYQQATEC